MQSLYSKLNLKTLKKWNETLVLQHECKKKVWYNSFGGFYLGVNPKIWNKFRTHCNVRVGFEIGEGGLFHECRKKVWYNSFDDFCLDVNPWI